MCVHGETMIWTFKALGNIKQLVKLVDIAIHNLHFRSFESSENNLIVQYGLLRTIYMSLREVGVSSYLETGKFASFSMVHDLAKCMRYEQFYRGKDITSRCP
jgi:hypothetical protein